MLCVDKELNICSKLVTIGSTFVHFTLIQGWIQVLLEEKYALPKIALIFRRQK